MRVAALVAAMLLVAGCNSNLSPTPTPLDCTVGFRAVYQLSARDGGEPGTTELEDAARAIQARLSRMGLTTSAVRTGENATIELELPFIADVDEVRAMVEPAGDIVFVPIPDDISIAQGDPLPPNLEPLFGRAGVQAVVAGFNETGQRALDLTLTPDAAEILEDYSGRSFGSIFAIAVDGVVLSAPVISGRLSGGRVQVSGGFASEAEITRLVTLLSLPPIPGSIDELSFAAVPPPPGCAATG